MNASDIVCQDNLNASQGLRGDRGPLGPQGSPGGAGGIGLPGPDGGAGRERIDMSFVSTDNNLLAEATDAREVYLTDAEIGTSPYYLPYQEFFSGGYKSLGSFIFSGTDVWTPTTAGVALSWNLLDSGVTKDDKLQVTVRILIGKLNVMVRDFTVNVSDFEGDERLSYAIIENDVPLVNLSASESIAKIQVKVTNLTSGANPSVKIHSFHMY